jgi:uncharacterized protein (TIGR02001 family)
MMKKAAFLLAAGLAAGALPTLALADDGLVYNIGAVSDYRYRGISQSKLRPALQGGIDYTKGPFYAGTWLSTIQWIDDTVDAYNNAASAAGAPTVSKGNAPVEWDLYLGTKGEVVKDLSYDVGLLAYVYIGGADEFHRIGSADPNTGEVYGALTYNIFTAKISVAPTNLFGVPDSKGSQYYDLSANFDLGNGFTLTPDAAYQNIAKHSALSYSDYSLTLAKDFGKGLSASLAVVATDADKNLYVTSDGKFTGRTGVVAGVKYTF